MKTATASFCFAVFLCFILIQDLSAASVSGQVQIEGGRPLSNIIIYLERAEGTPSKPVSPMLRVSQRGRKFEPNRTVLVKGGKIAFVNNEEKEIDHNVYSLSETRKFDIGLAQRGSVGTVNFPSTGEVKYYCSIHKNMEGVVVVVPTPYFVHANIDGAFRIDGVPAGGWMVKTVVPHRRYTSKPLSISLFDAPLDGIVVHILKKRRK